MRLSEIGLIAVSAGSCAELLRHAASIDSAREESIGIDDRAGDAAMLERAQIVHAAYSADDGNGTARVFGDIFEERQVADPRPTIRDTERNEQLAQRQSIQFVNDVEYVHGKRANPPAPNDATIMHIGRDGNRAGVKISDIGEPFRLLNTTIADDYLIDPGPEQSFDVCCRTNSTHLHDRICVTNDVFDSGPP
ncbi:MAG TPA: hypothetical protein VGP84_16955 [Gemmatimonadaceae bacterium]|nr:hypothetical protein [Gemmatimonadaceae bacterium]